MSSGSSDKFEIPTLTPAEALQTFTAPGLPPPTHAAEADTFARHQDVPAHDQNVLSEARVVVVGAGGLGSWTEVGLVRSGVRHLTIIEPDRFERTNAPRQLMVATDLGEPKAIAVARNLLPHAPAPLGITAMAMRFEEAVDQFPLPADLIFFLVDNNRCRLEGAQFARRRRIPAVFAMLSLDGMRVHTFLQGPDEADACVHCALPNLDPERAVPCAAAIISSCFLASAYAVFLGHRALMGWPAGIEPYNWREADLLGGVPDMTGLVRRRPHCPTCGQL